MKKTKSDSTEYVEEKELLRALPDAFDESDRIRYFFANSNGKREPEFELMVAVLEDAFNVVYAYKKKQNRQNTKAYKKVMRWFRTPGTEWIFDCESVCDNLNLDYLSIVKIAEKALYDSREVNFRRKRSTVNIARTLVA